MEYKHSNTNFFQIELMELLPVLLDNNQEDGNPIIVSPSNFMKEMVLTTDERLEKLKKPTRKVKIRDELSLNTFKAVPDIIIFQNFEVGGVYTVPLTLLNTYEVSKPLKIVFEQSPAFKISYSSETVCTKVAPGMAYQFNVTLSAPTIRDYNHKLIFVTEGETLIVPLIAIAPRPLLDIPDFLSLPTTPVKIASERTILVRNVGKVAAVFNLLSEAPFSVNPTRGMLEPDQYMQLSIYFNTRVRGCHCGQLDVLYQTGEKLTVGLVACSEEADIELERQSLEMTDTYMGLKTREFVRLINKSNHIVRFEFKLYKNQQIEDGEAEKYMKGFELVKENEKCRGFGVRASGLIEACDTHMNIYERIYEDEVDEFKTNTQFVYKNPNFEIDPTIGEIWPHNDTQLLIVFSPTVAEHYETTTYLEVFGREERIPLRLSGSGKGPTIELNVEELDAMTIFLCAEHHYEVSVRNIGDIPANVRYYPNKPDFGGDISFIPNKLYLDAGGYASFVMKFSSNIQGKFAEEIQFIIEESGEIIKFIFNRSSSGMSEVMILKTEMVGEASTRTHSRRWIDLWKFKINNKLLYCRGDVICPVLNFDITELTFHNIPLGFPVSKSVNLINTTQVPIEFAISIIPDGNTQPLCCEDYSKCVVKPKIHDPREFTVSHEEGIVLANTTLQVELTLLPNVDGRHQKMLQVQMWKTNKYSMSLPIKYHCHLPHIVCETKELLLRGCFVNYFYNRTIKLKNKNSYPGYFLILQQEDSSGEGVIYLPKISEGFIEPHEAKDIEIEISTGVVGQSIAHVFLAIFGGNPKFHICTIVCNGQGPVLSIPEFLDFGQIKTLKEVNQVIEIVNDSPVTAHVIITKNAKSIYEIDECDFQLGPSDKKELSVKIYFREPATFIEKIYFNIENSEKLVCTLKSVGVGSSILSEPEIDEEMHLGPILTHQKFLLEIKFTNMGRRIHKIIWSRKKSIRNWKETSQLDILTIFNLTPNRFELAPGQSIECVLEGYSAKPGQIEEDFYCHALIGDKKEFGVVSSFFITAEFVTPVLEISKKYIEFRIDNGADKVLEFLSDNLTIINMSKLLIKASISIDAPFYMLREDQKASVLQVSMDHKECMELRIIFEPVSKKKRCTVSVGCINITFDRHPHKETIFLRGVENYPNVELVPNVIEFGCLPNFFTGCVEVLMKNISPLPVSYQWEWIREQFEMVALEVTPIDLPRKQEEDSSGVSSVSEPIFEPAVELSDYPECSIGSDEQPVYKRFELEIPNLPEHKAEEELPPPGECIKITETERKPEYFDEIQTMLYQLVAKYDQKEEDLDALKHMPSTCQPRTCECLDLVPTYGYLGPYELQMISFEFSPLPNSSMKGVAHCHITGGDVEVVPISGTSCNLSFKLDKDVVEFGRTLFCEIRQENIVLKNTGYGEITFKVICKDPCDKNLTNQQPEIYWLFVTPREGTVLPGKEAQLDIKFFAGLTGEFTKTFMLEVGYMNSCTITVHGYAEPSQLICSLHRPSLETERVNYKSYMAIGSITDAYLDSVKRLTQVQEKYDKDIHYQTRDVLKQDGWVIVTYSDTYPTIHDIDLAINRRFLNEFLIQNPTILQDHTTSAKFRPIPRYSTMPYLVDFGFVVRETVGHYTVLLENYGPVKIAIKLQPVRHDFKDAGFEVQMSRAVLEVGDTTQLFILFYPTAKRYPTVNRNISYTIYLTIPHGPKIPLDITAFLTLPEISVKNLHLHFGQLAMGQCMKKTIAVNNTGCVRSQWSAKIERKGNQTQFYIRTFKGSCEPGETCFVDVYFEPKIEGRAAANLILTVDQNPVEVVIKLRGMSVKPMLLISDRRVCFQPTLPYTQNIELTFTVENINPFPVEYFFADFDELVDVEEKALTLTMEYYRTKCLYLPPREPGSGLPTTVTNFYYSMLNKVREKLIVEEKVGSISGIDSSVLNETGPLKSRRSSSLGRRKSANINTAPTTYSDPLESKSPEEIEELLREQLAILSQYPTTPDLTVPPPDPVAEAIVDAQPVPELDPTGLMEGILLIFHGSPETNCNQVANRASLIMKLPVYHVDQLIVDSLVQADTFAAIKVNQLINENFICVASETDLVNPPYYDEYERLQRKIDVLLLGKPKQSQKKLESKKSTKEKSSKDSGKLSKSSSKGSKKGKQGKKQKQDKTSKGSSKKGKSSSRTSKKEKQKIDKRETLLGLPEDLLFEILQIKLSKFRNGLVIQSLDSVFIRRPLVVLSSLLKAIGNIRYIHCIILSYTYDDFVTHNKQTTQAEEQKAVDLRNKIISDIRKMDEVAYANLSPEDMALFKEQVLKQRKLNMLRKRKELIMRLEALKNKSKNLKLQSRKKSTTGKTKRGKLSAKSNKSRSMSAKKSEGSTDSKRSRISSRGSKKTGRTSSKGSRKRSKKDNRDFRQKTPEEAEIKKKLEDAEKLCFEILHTLEYWDRKNNFLTVPLPVKVAAKKSSSKKSKSSKGSKKSSKKSSKGSKGPTEPTDSRPPSKPASVQEVTEPIDRTPEELEMIMQIGVPCWFINNANVQKLQQVNEQLSLFLQHTPALQEARTELMETAKTKDETPTEVFTVVCRNFEVREKNVSDVFILTDAETIIKEASASKQGSTISSNIESPVKEKSDSKSSVSKKRKRAKRSRSRQSSLSVDNRSNSSFSRSLSMEVNFGKSKGAPQRELTARSVINPGQIFTYRVYFEPTACGDYKHIYTLRLVGWPTKYEIVCEGKSDLPKINMSEKVLFEKCVTRRERSNMFERSLYVIETSSFEFGPILIPPVFIHFDYPRLMEKASVFNFENCATLPCETTLLFNSNPTKTFQCDQNSLLVNPGQTVPVRFTANPEKVGTVESQLIIITKNNPKVETVNICCTGCDVQFSIEPTVISFDRGLLNVTDTRSIKLINKSLVPLRWKTVDATNVMESFHMSVLRGRVLPCSESTIDFTFTPRVIEDIPKVELEINVFDDEFKLTEPIFSDNLEISAEVIDVEVDCPHELNFGEVKGRMEHVIQFPILSKIKYDVEFSFIDVPPYQKYYEQETIRKMFKVSPERVVLKCAKHFYATVTFFPNRVVDFENVPIFQCVVIDTVFKNVMETVTVTATGKTYLAKFQLCPPEEMYFGHQLIGTEKFEDLVLTNTGKFEFTYTVLSQSKILEQKAKKAKTKGKKGKKKKKGSKSSSKGSKKSNKSSKSSKTSTTKTSKTSETEASKGGKKKGGKKGKKGSKKGSAEKTSKTKVTSLTVGCFNMVSSTGTLPPNESTAIKVMSRPKQDGVFHETVLFFISECEPADRKGRPVVFSVTGSVPQFDFHSYGKIFSEHYVVNSMGDFVCPDQLGEHCVFVKEEETLHFNKVCINTTAEARLKMQNTGLVPAELTAELRVNASAKGIFAVVKKTLTVEPYSYDYITIIFKPNAINTYTGVLDITYHSPICQQPKILDIKLSGDGYIPELTILDPEKDPVTDTYEILFNPTLIGQCVTKPITFENSGLVPCKVILEICQDSENMLSIKPTDWSLVKTIWDTDVSDLKHTMVISLLPKQKGIFEIEFRPCFETKLNCTLKVHVVNNPFEVFMMNIKADSLLEDVIIEGLTPLSVDELARSRECLFKIMSRYELDFGFCFMNTLQKKCFKIKNDSDYYIYRFEFTNYDKLVFIPAVGHLKPLACKEILVTFLTREPVNFVKEVLNCMICKIEYTNTEYEPLSWDERQNLVVWQQLSTLSFRSRGSASTSPERTSVTNSETNTSITKSKSNADRAGSAMSKSSKPERTTSGSSSRSKKPSKTSTEITSSSRVRQSAEVVASMGSHNSETSVTKIRQLEDRSEPEYIQLPETTKSLQLLLSITADYSSYQCDVKEISMEDTLMFEKRSASFSVRNTSIVPLYVKWKVSMDEQYPRRINSNLGSVKSKERSSHSTVSTGLEYSSGKASSNRPRHLSGKELFLPSECTPPPSTKTSLFSSSGNLTSRTNDSWCDQDLVPFMVTPEFATIPASASQHFTVTFTPNDVFQYVVHVKSCVPNTKQEFNNIDVIVSARSLLPLYHFDIAPSNYLESKRQGRKLCQDIADENTRVVEFEAVGLGRTNTRKFNIINPTGENFDFKWNPSQANGKDLVLFHCHTPSGFVTKGKMAEAEFSFIPQEVGTFEAFYIFTIEKYYLKTTFLLAGISRNPCVFFSTPHLKLKATILEMDVTDSVTLKNNENMELRFEFKKKSLYSGDHLDKLLVQPMRGTLMPFSQAPIKIVYHPVKTGETDFNLKCFVELMKQPITLAVTANCFDIQPVVMQVDGDVEVTLNPQKITNIDLKSMVPLRWQDTKFVIRNVGKIGFYFTWICKEKCLDDYAKVGFKDTEGYVCSKLDIVSTVSLKAVRDLTQKKIKAKLQILYGPKYVLTFTCTTLKAKYKFSFTEYNFGPCLVQLDKTTYYKCCLEFTSCDSLPLMLEYNSNDQDYFSILFKVKEVAPKMKETITIYFHPQEVKQYCFEITFLINSKLEVIKIFGEGVPLLIEVEDPSNKFPDLGAVLTGKSISKKIKVINKSACPVCVVFELYERLPYFSRPKRLLISEYEREPPPKCVATEEVIPEESAEERERRLIREFVTVTPKNFRKLLPGGKCDFVIKFAPTERMSIFSEKISYQVQDCINTICVFKASCVAPEYYVNRERVAFGNVIKNGSTESKFTLYNIGDIGGKFSWKFEKYDHAVTITPMEGYISPDMSVTFVARFQPTRIECLVKAKARCTIEHYNKRVEINFSGTCIDLPQPKDTIRFICPVRTEYKNTIAISNPSNAVWNLTPVLSGQYFFAPDVVVVQPQNSANCEITYKPKVMTFDGIHKATLIFKHLDGNGMLYNLEGVSEKPLFVRHVEKTIPCKNDHVEDLEVENWLKIPQQFKVITENLKPEQTIKQLYKLTGNAAIDVAPFGKRRYKWIIQILNQGLLQFNVIFRNESTKEYLFYEIFLNVIQCEPLEVIHLKTCARIPATYRLKLENPIKTPVTFTITSGSDLLTHEDSVTIEPFREYLLTVEYKPLLPGQTNTILEITTEELGTYPYKFILTANNAVPESPIVLKAHLGQRVVQKTPLNNFSKNKVDFQTKLENSDIFSVNPHILIEPEHKGFFEVDFEPDNLGNVQSVLTLNSTVAGEYIYPLIGTCILPKPQGPIPIKFGSFSTVNFKNPFEETKTFTFHIESDSFSVKPGSEIVRGKAATKINVFLDHVSGKNILVGKNYPLTGKLVVNCAEPNLSHVKWIYYLQADF